MGRDRPTLVTEMADRITTGDCPSHLEPDGQGAGGFRHLCRVLLTSEIVWSSYDLMVDLFEDSTIIDGEIEHPVVWIESSMSIVRVTAGIENPLEKQIAFASIDSNGHVGLLNSFVLEHFGLDPETELAEVRGLESGYGLISGWNFLIILVVTIGKSRKAQTLLENNLLEALEELRKLGNENTRLWIPLMGTGEAGLEAEQSLVATLDALLKSKIASGRRRYTIDFSFGSDVTEDETKRLKNRIEFTLGLEVLSPDAGHAATVHLESDPAPFLPDQPTFDDSLQRRAIADAIVGIAREVYPPLHASSSATTAAPNQGFTQAFKDLLIDVGAMLRQSPSEPQSEPGAVAETGCTYIIHIHGPWGSGKSSVLNFIRTALGGPGNGPPWIVVDFNAWRHQTSGPAWWALLTEVYANGVMQLPPLSRLRVRGKELWWRFRSSWAPYVLILAIVFWVLAIFLQTEGRADLTNWLKVIATVFTIWGGFVTFSKTARIGPGRTAKTFLELSHDPQRVLARHYLEVVLSFRRPVAVFIDDLDRCDGQYVVDLMQCIQTTYREAPVVYVVAADRAWIRSSYEAAYQSYVNDIGEPGRPLGYLFLEKIFQLSISLPQLSQSLQEQFWESLLTGNDGVGQGGLQRTESDHYEDLKAATSDDEVMSKLDQASNEERAAMAAAAFRRLQDSDLREKREHVLLGYSKLIEPNPRSIKRLLNAYGFKVGYELLAGRKVRDNELDAMIRWTIVELRWPTLADHLAKNPESISAFGGSADAPQHTPNDLKPLFQDRIVREIVDPLSPDLVRRLTCGEGGGLTAGAASA